MMTIRTFRDKSFLGSYQQIIEIDMDTHEVCMFYYHVQHGELFIFSDYTTTTEEMGWSSPQELIKKKLRRTHNELPNGLDVYHLPCNKVVTLQQKTPFAFGQRAYRSGVKCVPLLDRDFVEFHIKKLNFGEGAELMEEWIQGWTAANLNQPVILQ